MIVFKGVAGSARRHTDRLSVAKSVHWVRYEVVSKENDWLRVDAAAVAADPAT